MAAGTGWRPALRRTIPANATVETIDETTARCLVIRHPEAGGTRSIAAWVHGDDPWIGITETLAFGKDTPTGGFTADWTFDRFEEPGEVFTPHLQPEADDVIGEHVLRSGVLSAQDGSTGASLAVDLDAVAKQRRLPAFLSLTRTDGGPTLTVGLAAQEVRGHVFIRKTAAMADARSLFIAYRLTAKRDPEPGEMLRIARRDTWRRVPTGKPTPPQIPAAELAAPLYQAAIEATWRERTADGRRIGALTTSRTFPGDVWMCPWFHNLSTGFGLWSWGKKTNRTDWVDRAKAIRELHLAAPLDRGLFPTMFEFGTNGKPDRWHGSHPQGGGLDVLHLGDISYTMYWLLLWHRELEPDPRINQRAVEHLHALGRLIRPDGGLPAYLDRTTQAPVSTIHLDSLKAALKERPGGDGYIPAMLDRWGTERFTGSAEDGAALLFTAELISLPDLDPAVRREALALAGRLAKWLITRVVNPAWYITMETHWSCAPVPLGFRDARSGQHPQDLIAVWLAALGLLRLSEQTKDPVHRSAAHRAMDRLCLSQQLFDPPFLSFDGFGGYPAQNTDGEWSDARQALFVIAHETFHRETGEQEHLDRAIAACRASFTTLFHPAAAPAYPAGWARNPQGFAAENHGHGGRDELNGVSSFHWGAGSALMSAAWLDRRGHRPW